MVFHHVTCRGFGFYYPEAVARKAVTRSINARKLQERRWRSCCSFSEAIYHLFSFRKGRPLKIPRALLLPRPWCFEAAAAASPAWCILVLCVCRTGPVGVAAFPHQADISWNSTQKALNNFGT